MSPSLLYCLYTVTYGFYSGLFDGDFTRLIWFPSTFVTKNGRVVRLKVSPLMGWLAGSVISLISPHLSTRRGGSPVGAVLYRHYLPAEFQFTEENRAKQQAFGRRKTRSTARQAALFGHYWLQV